MPEPRLVIGLNAVLSALDGTAPKVLCVERALGPSLPFGRFDPDRHRTFEIGLREFIERQADVPVGYVEQLYTFGDMGREAPRARMKDGTPSDRVVSVGYLGLAPEITEPAIERASWCHWYTYFPWEDLRNGPSKLLTEDLIPALLDWAGQRPGDRMRVDAAFGLGDAPWEEERVLDRYELMYEARLVEEAARDVFGEGDGEREPSPGRYGQPMMSDHRRILATAIDRLRGKLRYRPIVFQMVPPVFTLTDLQRAVEAILGFPLHKQNFRRSVEAVGLAEKTGEVTGSTGGRPAALYRASRLALQKHGPGLPLPRFRPKC
ncbi:hypothetical protein PB2503_02557 [Parvularcula bermudensis HTCC2503]|uniref:NrtR DNA-binding winged helix domain-containing protein n=1 Tax=Parvularcula bermudensis (strain ATCC BAA-594 / HTCC2503 / KCTC 12087) TaxID=314260 RepID=E0TCJ9_PARBH|nr:hypothetical protein [Parvularcula bermudensis]ADM08588.1 hypothetical protein PB2503_02557 [Parvularcula bermudensis HTCC2503]